jgi:hypothetical protein
MSNFRNASKNAKKKFFGKDRFEVKKGMGFKNAKKNIMARGMDEEAAGAILASGARNASKFAKKQNPNLKHVR